MQRRWQGLDCVWTRRIDENELFNILTILGELVNGLKCNDASCTPTGQQVGSSWLAPFDFLYECFSHTYDAAFIFFRDLHVRRVQPENSEIRGEIRNIHVRSGRSASIWNNPEIFACLPQTTLKENRSGKALGWQGSDCCLDMFCSG